MNTENDLIQELDSFIAQYELANELNITDGESIAIYKAVNLSDNDIVNATSEELFIHAYSLHGYVSKLTREQNKATARYNWANDGFNDCLHHYLKTEKFDDYTKYQTKEQYICDTYEVVNKFRKLMRVTKTVTELYNDKINPFNRKADILYQIARNRCKY